MQQPFMKAYATQLVQICHKRGAHAIGGMSAFIPSKDEQLNRLAFEQVQADKQREAALGYDGTWVAHPQLVPIARSVFDEQLGSNPHQKQHLPDGQISQSALMTVTSHTPITEAGVRTNIRVGLQYLAFWMAGQGAVAIHHLMEDAATAEISRAQLWQWLRHQVQLEDGRTFSRARYDELLNQELQQLQADLVSHPQAFQRLPEAFRIFRKVTQQAEFAEFITLEAYPYL
jgi:malate synthase